MTKNSPHFPLSNINMSKQVLISMLRQGNNGAEILTILDAITDDTVSDTQQAQPTLEEIDF